MRHAFFPASVVFAVVAIQPCLAPAAITVSSPVPTLAANAARIFRGECIAAVPTTVEVAGARIGTTEYTFRVIEPLKGCGPGTLVFRQVGRPGGGRLDLGALAGLPTYEPGSEYVLLLVPESRIGLTSPAGGGQGAYRVLGQGGLVPLRAALNAPAVSGSTVMDNPITYDDLRSLVRKGASR